MNAIVQKYLDIFIDNFVDEVERYSESRLILLFRL